MRRVVVVVISCLIILLSLVFIGQVIYYRSMLKGYKKGNADKTENINVMLTRADNWKRVINDAVITQDQMTLIDGSTATIPITAEILRQFWLYTDEQVNRSPYVRHSTTHYAYEKLIDKSKSLIFVTQPSSDELSLAEKNDVSMDVVPVAKDGFVFITHKDNPIDSLTIEQIQGIYTGQITNWKQLGGEDVEIIAYQREKNSGSQTAMLQMVMKDKKIIEPINTKIYFGMGSLVDAVAEYENRKASIGYTYYYYIINLYKNENIKVLKVNGISPDNKNLLDNSYPFTTSYYAVIRSDESEKSSARLLRDFLLTEEGQRLIEIAGYCRSVVSDE